MELKQRIVENNIYAGYGKSDLSVEKKRRALSEGAERRELLTDYSAPFFFIRFPSLLEAF